MTKRTTITTRQTRSSLAATAAIPQYEDVLLANLQDRVRNNGPSCSGCRTTQSLAERLAKTRKLRQAIKEALLIVESEDINDW
jgi:hypothetical protein